MKSKFSFLLLACFILLLVQPTLAGEVTYYHNDASGTPVMASDAEGNIIWREHYKPYGEKLNNPADVDIGYTGHEYDAETGLTYMQARYYDPVVGRFLAIDPIGFKPRQPMTFNRYSYANNNPYKYIDPDGRWPTDIHNTIIDTAFPGLSSAQRQTLKTSSANVDGFFNGGQSVENSYQHSMKGPNQTATSAKSQTQNFIKNQISAASTAQGTMPASVSDINSTSLTAVGAAIHTVTDGTSPAHSAANGNPKTWGGLSHPIDAIQHAGAESSISPEQMKNAVNAAQEIFKKTYGTKLSEQAIKPNGT